MIKPYRAELVTMKELGIRADDLINHRQALEKYRGKLLP